MNFPLSLQLSWIAATLGAVLALGVILPNIYVPLSTVDAPELAKARDESVALAKLAYVAWGASAIGLVILGHGRVALLSRLGWLLLVLLIASALLKSCGPM